MLEKKEREKERRVASLSWSHRLLICFFCGSFFSISCFWARLMLSFCPWSQCQRTLSKRPRGNGLWSSTDAQSLTTLKWVCDLLPAASGVINLVPGCSKSLWVVRYKNKKPEVKQKWNKTKRNLLGGQRKSYTNLNPSEDTTSYH